MLKQVLFSMPWSSALHGHHNKGLCFIVEFDQETAKHLKDVKRSNFCDKYNFQIIAIINEGPTFYWNKWKIA